MQRIYEITRSVIAIACMQACLLQPTPPLAQTGHDHDALSLAPDGVPSYAGLRETADHIRREVMIPMRDGTRLFTVIMMKKGTNNGPILLSRTPYDAKSSTQRTASQRIEDVMPIADTELVKDGYIRVFQDIRGLHRSEGDFVMTRPLIGALNTSSTDESTDAYDTIDWLVKHVPESSGKVGVIGSSYLGFTALMATIHSHPALKVAVSQSPEVDGWIGDDYFHNGAFRPASLNYVLAQSTGRAAAGARIARGAGDDFTTYLEAGSAGDFARQWGIDQLPYVRKLMQNAAYTDFWSGQAVDRLLAKQPLTVPTMLVVGQWDQEDSYGAPAAYRALEAKDLNNDKVSLVIGPWRHSGVNHYGFELGPLTFSGDTALEFRVKYLKPFLDHHLKNGPDPKTPPVLTYATGVNQWEVSPRWPMGTLKPLYLAPKGTASFEVPRLEGHDEYVSDPAKPVPFVPRPIRLNSSSVQWRTWLVQDQRFVSDRPDVLSYKTEPLDHAVHIMGAPQVSLFAATSGSDSDWVVKLIDVYPGTIPEDADQGAKPPMAGYELPIGIEIFRGRYVHGFATPGPLKPGQAEHYRFSLPNVDHVFLPGHRILVHVQSTLFPVYDRNPQTYVPNIFDAQPHDYRPATQRIFNGGARASAVLLPIVGEGGTTRGVESLTVVCGADAAPCPEAVAKSSLAGKRP